VLLYQCRGGRIAPSVARTKKGGGDTNYLVSFHFHTHTHIVYYKKNNLVGGGFMRVARDVN
jgi:hypothetical protein